MINKERKITDTLFDIAWVLLIVTQCVLASAWYALTESAVKVLAYKGVFLLSCALCAAVIIINLIKRVYPLKAFICYAIFGIICALSWFNTKNNLLIWMFLIFMAAYGLSGRRIISISTVITGLALVITVALSNLGLAENYIFDENLARPRYSLGFSWTTNAPTLLFFFTLQYLFLRKSKMKVWEYLLIEAANVYLFLMTDTNLPFLLISALLVFFAAEGLFKNHWRLLKHLKVLYLLMPLIICAVTIWLYVVYGTATGSFADTLEKLNEALNNRLVYGNRAITQFGLTPFGQKIIWYGMSIKGTSGTYNYVDCSYILLLLDCGIAFLAAALLVYVRMIYRAIKCSDFWLVIIVMVLLLHGFTEPRLMDISFNIIPVLAFLKLGEEPVLYTRDSLKEVFMGKREEKQIEG